MKNILKLYLLLALATVANAQTPVIGPPALEGVVSINLTSGAFTFTGPGVSCSGTTCTFSGASSGTVSGQVVNTIPLNTNGASNAINSSSGITQTGSGTSTVDTFPGAISNNGGLYQNMGTNTLEEVEWGSRVGVGIPVPYVVPVSASSQIAFDVAPTAGATDFNSTTGVGWIDICDAIFTNPCTAPSNSNYETLRLGIMANGTTHIESAHGGTGNLHPLCLQCGSGNGGGVTIGGLLSETSAAPLGVFATANPYMNLGVYGGGNQSYWGNATASGFLFSNMAAGDMGIRNANGNMYFGANSGTSSPATMEIAAGSPGTAEFFGPAIATNSNPTIYTTTTVPNGTSPGVYFMGENTSAVTGSNACDYLSAINSGGYNTFVYLCDVSTSTNYLGNLTILTRSGASTYAEQAKLTESTAVDGGTWITGNYTATQPAATVASGQISYGGTTTASSNCGSLSGAAGCIVVNIAGATHYVPYW